ncbi:uncharacterized protein METZ01_LOCUS282765 [marine metagenome]|uniref:Uncharacterized protein n=1 Tax=marine metagenome TaxID=408172 RepID=A0A382L4U5_9ZZZZ
MDNTLLNLKRLLIPIFLSIICCNTENSKVEKEKKNLEFNINFELLNPEPISDGEGFMMNVPANWNPLDSLLKSELTRSFSLLGEPTKLILVNAFQSQDGSQCIISKVITDKKDFSFISEDVISDIQLKIHGDGYKTNDLNINNLSAKQYLVRGKNHVIIKLFIQLNEFYQIDFIIPLSQYKMEIESIESSIGTIRHK